MKAVADAAARLRNKLGESLSTVEKFDTPIEQATTPSLEALQAYSLGWKGYTEKGNSGAAVPLFQQAIRLDPNFAMAYLRLGEMHYNFGETHLAAQSIRKAYELRDRVSEREKLSIESNYHELVTGKLEKARQANELWAQTYPRDYSPLGHLGVIDIDCGQYDEALTEFRESLRLKGGTDTGSYVDLSIAYLYLNRLKEARAAAQEAQAKKLDSPNLREVLYELAFLQNDVGGMAQQLAWAVGRPGVDDQLVYFEAATAAYSGRLGKARELSRRAVASAERAEEKEAATGYEAGAAMREALFGNAPEARRRAAALVHSTDRDVQYGATLALALTGDTAQPQALADNLAKRFPEDTAVQFNYLSTVRAQLELNRKDYSKAIQALQVTTPYELGDPGTAASHVALYPVYVRCTRRRVPLNEALPACQVTGNGSWLPSQRHLTEEIVIR